MSISHPGHDIGFLDQDLVTHGLPDQSGDKHRFARLDDGALRPNRTDLGPLGDRTRRNDGQSRRCWGIGQGFTEHVVTERQEAHGLQDTEVPLDTQDESIELVVFAPQRIDPQSSHLVENRSHLPSLRHQIENLLN